VVPDRVQAATYMAAVAVAGGDIVVRSARTEHMEELLNCYARMGVAVTPQRDGIRVTSHERLRAIDFVTEPYPGIATDYKPLLVRCACPTFVLAQRWWSQDWWQVAKPSCMTSTTSTAGTTTSSENSAVLVLT
jgi:hypothetical protein